MNKITGIMVSMIAIIAVLAAVVTPMTMEFSKQIHSVAENEGSGFNLIETEEYTRAYIDDTGTAYINDVKITDLATYTMVMFTDTFVLRYTNSVNTFSLQSATGGISINEIEMENGTWTAYTNDSTVSGTYDFIMRWTEKGSYLHVRGNSAYINNDSTIFIAQATTSTESFKNGVWMGTPDNISAVYNNGNETTPFTISTETYTTDPEVLHLTEFDGPNCFLFVPIKYDTLTGMDEMLRMLVSMMPVLIGLMFFAAVGMTMVNRIKQ